jgi:hypothetical protein
MAVCVIMSIVSSPGQAVLVALLERFRFLFLVVYSLFLAGVCMLDQAASCCEAGCCTAHEWQGSIQHWVAVKCCTWTRASYVTQLCAW